MDHRWFPFQPLGAGVDFVIFGVGLGATLVLVGWLWRTVGPRLRYRAADDSVLSGEEMVARISWRRFCRSGGALWVMGGFLLVLAAYASLLLSLSDHTGAVVVVATALAILLAIVLWLAAYLHRFGLIGLVPPRQPVTVPATAAPQAQPDRSSRVPRKTPAPVAAAVHGPATPADIATTIATSATDASQPEPEPTVIGATERADGSVEATAAQPDRGRSRPPRLVNAHHLARDAATSPSAARNVTKAATMPEAETATSSETVDPTASGGDADAAATANAEPDAPIAPRRDGAANEREQSIPRIGSDEFRAAIVRQREHLARAAARGSATAARPRGGATPAPDGVEGTDWVRGDGTSTVPDGFPVKGNARSHRYHPAGAPSYDATIAEFYFATPAAAEAAGYRLPKSLRETNGASSNDVRPDHHP